MPAWAYRRLRQSGLPPVRIRDGIAIYTDEQDRAQLLCAGCEGLLHRNGEAWAAKHAWSQQGGFPLLDLVKKLPRMEVRSGIYRSNAFAVTEINLGQLAHFGAGVNWRYHAAGRIELGPYAEPLRAYLHGETGFPERFALSLHLLGGGEAQNLAPPRIVGRNEVSRQYPVEQRPRVCGFQVAGLAYNLTYGRPVPAGPHEGCLVCTGAVFFGPAAEDRFRRASDAGLAQAELKGRLARDWADLGKG